MRLDARFAPLEVDGQRLYLLPPELAGAVLDAGGRLEGRPVAVGEMLAQYLKVVEHAPDLTLAVGEAPEPDKPWILMHLVRIDGELVRVLVEGQVCGECGWSGLVGVHRHLQLYAGTPDPWAAMQARWHLPPAGCPRCDAPLSRQPVWAHPGPP